MSSSNSRELLLFGSELHSLTNASARRGSSGRSDTAPSTDAFSAATRSTHTLDSRMTSSPMVMTGI